MTPDDVHNVLTPDEAEAVRSLGELEAALFALHVVPVQERMRQLARRLELRLDLEPGSLGKTHAIDGDRVTTKEA